MYYIITIVTVTSTRPLSLNVNGSLWCTSLLITVHRESSGVSVSLSRVSELALRLIRLAPNVANLGLFQIRWAQMYWNLIWRSPGFVSFEANLTQYLAISDIPVLSLRTIPVDFTSQEVFIKGTEHQFFFIWWVISLESQFLKKIFLVHFTNRSTMPPFDFCNVFFFEDNSTKYNNKWPIHLGHQSSNFGVYLGRKKNPTYITR